MKKNFKFLIILTILLTACLCIGSTFAADISVTDINDVSSVDNNINMEIVQDDLSSDDLGQDVNQDGLSQKEVEINNLQEDVGTFSDLQRECSNAGRVLNLTRNYKFDPLTDSGYYKGVSLSELIIINGNGFTIDGAGLARVFHVIGNNVTIQNINFINAKSTDAGAIHWNGSNGKIIGCNFTNCTVSGSNLGDSAGGAIYWVAANGTVSNCNFIECSASGRKSSGGAISWWGVNGAINGSNFVNCFADMNGSAICNNMLSFLSITNCTCTPVDGDEKAPIYNNGLILSEVVVTTFDGETKYVRLGSDVNISASVTTSGIPIAGGTVKFTYGDTVVTVNSDLNGFYYVPYTTDTIGALPVNATYLQSYGAETVNAYGLYVYENTFTQLAYDIEHCDGDVLVFHYNYSYNPDIDSDYVNGIIINKDNFVIDGNGFTINGLDLARVFNVTANKVILKNINFVNIHSTEYGAIYWGANNGILADCAFTDCTCDYWGTAIYWNGANGGVGGCNFTNCSADAAGAIYWNGDNGFVFYCNFNNCAVSGSNLGDSSGGAIYWLAANGVVSNCNFTECSASGRKSSGGAISWWGMNGSIIYSNFVNCFADMNGSAICNNMLSFLNIRYCTCTPVDGDEKAPIYNNGVILSEVVVTTFDGETKYVRLGSDVNISASVTTSGIPIAGGTVKFTYGDTVVTVSSDLNGFYYVPYTADTIGALPVNATYLQAYGAETVNAYGLYVYENTFTQLAYDIEHCDGDVLVFHYNYSYNPDIDADYVNGVSLNKTNFVIDGNGFTIDGSNLARVFNCVVNNVTIQNINFINAVFNNGGVIYLNGVDNTKIINCNFTNSFAEGNAGAIYLYQSTKVTISSCIFTNCTCDWYGGAMYVFSSWSTIDSCSFVDCSSRYGYGGVIFFINGGISTVSSTNFINSSALKGGSIYMVGVHVSVDSCNFINSTVNESGIGPAIYVAKDGYLNVSNCTCTPVDGDERAPLHVNVGYIVSDVVIVTLGGMNKYVRTGDTINLTAILTTNGIRIDGYVLEISCDGRIFSPKYTSEGIFYHEYTANTRGTIPVKARCLCIKEGQVTLYSYNLSVYDDSFSQLAYDIKHSDDVLVLNHSYYFNPEMDSAYVDGVVINKSNFVIDGNGCNILGINLARVFDVTADNVTIKNINFINTNSSVNGGTIYWNGINGYISGCNFTNSSARYSGGAIYWYNDNGIVSDCNFINSSSDYSGGAICWNAINGTVRNCNFDNSVSNIYGGSIYWDSLNGTVSNCNFDNSVVNRYGGAICWNVIDGTVSNSNFVNCSAEYGSAVYVGEYCSLDIYDSNCTPLASDEKAPIYNDGFISSEVVITTLNGTNKNDTYGDKVNLTANVSTSGIAVAGGIITLKVNNTEVNVTSNDKGIYSALYTVDFMGTHTVDANYINATGSQTVNAYNITVVPSDGFTQLANDIAACEGDKFILTHNYSYYEGYDSPYTDGVSINKDNFVIDGNGFTINGSTLARAFKVNGDNVTIKNINFTNTNANEGGAIYWNGLNGTISACNFISSYAECGSAIYINQTASLNISDSNSILLPGDTLAPIYNDGLILSDVEIVTMDAKIIKVAYGDEINLTGSVTVSGIPVAGGNLTFIVDGNNISVNSDENGLFIANYTVGFNGNRYVDAIYDKSNEDLQLVIPGKLTSGTIDVFVNADDIEGFIGDTVIVKVFVSNQEGYYVDGGVVTIVFDGKNYTEQVIDGFANFEFKLEKIGEYSVSAFYDGSTTGLYNDGQGNFTITVNKMPTVISASNLEINAYASKDLVITLKDANGNLLAGKKVTFYINGNTYIRATDSNGQAKLAIRSIYTKNYPTTIKFEGDNNYLASSKSVNVTVVASYVTVYDIIKAAKTLKTSSEKNKELPTSIQVGSYKLTPGQLTYLMTVAVKCINAGKSVSTQVKVINVKYTEYNGKVSKSITKANYLKVVNYLYSKGVNGTLPKYFTYDKVIGYNVYTYSIAKILAYYASERTLPTYCVFTNY